MPKGPKGMLSSENLLGQMRQLQQELKTAQKELEKEEICEDVQGGAIQITFTGGQVCKSIKIDEDLWKNTDVHTMESLLVEGINKALEKVRKQTMKKLGPLSSMGK